MAARGFDKLRTIMNRMAAMSPCGTPSAYVFSAWSPQGAPGVPQSRDSRRPWALGYNAYSVRTRLDRTSACLSANATVIVWPIFRWRRRESNPRPCASRPAFPHTDTFRDALFLEHPQCSCIAVTEAAKMATAIRRATVVAGRALEHAVRRHQFLR